MIRTASFPTRYVAFENPGVWVFLDIAWDNSAEVPPPAHGHLGDVRWTEMAVYSQPQVKESATIRRHPTAIQGKEYVAEVCRAGHGDSLLASSFAEAVALAEAWLSPVRGLA